MRHKSLGVLMITAAALISFAIPAAASSAAPGAGGYIENPLPAGQQPHGYSPTATICPSGAEQCTDTIVARMEKNYASLGCDHNATFAELYLDTTLQIRNAIRNNEFSDRTFWNQIAQTFGTYYLDSYTAWSKGQDSRVPEAWRMAFDAAHTGKVTTLGDVFLGINAHVNRDLAFVYYQTGASNFDDHTYVNTVLGRAAATAYPNIFTNLDNTIYAQLAVVPTTLDLDIFAWRDQAWDNAQRLAAAPNAQARAVIAAEIDANAKAKALAIEAAFPATAQTNAARDAYCAAQR